LWRRKDSDKGIRRVENQGRKGRVHFEAAKKEQRSPRISGIPKRGENNVDKTIVETRWHSNQPQRRNERREKEG